MGLDESDVIYGVVGCGGKSFSPSYVSCSICLELVTVDGDRSWAKLQCGHQFHLDCIGSAFNAKGVMQCPNCRKIEKGHWLYATDSRSSPEFNWEDWTSDEDLYELSYSETSFEVPRLPFTPLSRDHSSFDEPEFPSSGYHDFLGQSTMFAEHAAVTSSSSAANVSDGFSFSYHWSGPAGSSEIPSGYHDFLGQSTEFAEHGAVTFSSSAAGSSEIPTSYGFAATDPHYHNWEHLLSSRTARGDV